MSAAIDTTGADVEAHSLDELEQVIADGLKTFVDVGQALARIRDEKLYRATHKTFEAYCRERWDFTRVRAHQLIKAAEVSENVNHGLQNPIPERQTRELSKLKEPEQQREAWQEAVDTAPEGKVTAKHVAAVVAKRVPQPEPEAPREEPEAPAWDDDGYEPAPIKRDEPVDWECPDCGSRFDGHRADTDGWVARGFCGHCEETETSETDAPTETEEPEPEVTHDVFVELQRQRDSDQELQGWIRMQVQLQAHMPSKEMRAALFLLQGGDVALATLGLSWRCTSDELKNAFREAARWSHPDRGGSVDDFRLVEKSRSLVAEFLGTES
jgi:hypothetical protein